MAALFHEARMTLPQAATLNRGWNEMMARAEAARAAGFSIAERLDEINSWLHAADPALRSGFRDPATQEELGELYRTLHGDGPVVGNEGRRT